ncbi:hypothetical protein [Halorussus sp. AFM4]|uniref:hypothetical protein n=1 Tax=Halorussus sp. AFM4 TaxID=3421651 RepID=UPI003EC13913
MIAEGLLPVLQTAVTDQLLLTVLQGLVVVGFLGISLLAAHLLVRAVRTDTGEFRTRDAKLMLAGASLLFVLGFTRLTVTDEIPAETLASVALGFAGVAYLLYTTRPELFERAEGDRTPGSVEEPTD